MRSDFSLSTILCLQLGNDNKNNFPKIIFVLTSTTPITEVLHDPEISIDNNDFFPLYFHVPSSTLVLDSVGYHSYKTRHSTPPLRYRVEYRHSTAYSPNSF